MAKQPTKRKPVKPLAERIADHLFTNYRGRQVDRLVQVTGDWQRPETEKYGGGWCRQAVIDVIQKELTRGQK